MRIVIFLLLCTIGLSAATYTAASCSQSNVNSVINGPTSTAVDGDIIQIPSGSCSWTSGITVPDGIGITIKGVGTPASDGATKAASASCGSNTVITVSNGATAFSATPDYGNATTRISCMQLAGSSSAVAMKIVGTCTASGCPDIRIDNINFTGWAGITHPGNSYGITAIGDVFGTIDHNTIAGTTGQYLHLVQFSHASYMGVGLYGDNAWAQPEDYGTNKFLFIENNLFSNSGCCENETSLLGAGKLGGGRIVVRYNEATSADSITTLMSWHGTETAGRPRSTRTFEFYGNTYTCASGVSCGQVSGSRGGTGIVWGNTTDKTGAGLNTFFNMATYRTQADIGGWGACDGSSVWDTNDGVTYYTGTVLSGGGTQTVTVSGSPGWTTNQWVVDGAPYSLRDSTVSKGSEISANGSNTVTIKYAGAPGAWLPANGDSIQILRATVCLDQAGGRGAGLLYDPTSPATPSSPANQALSPTYIWSNTFIGGNTVFGSAISGVLSNTARVIRSRDFYTENTNQAIQSSSSAPFDGTATIGIGHGTIANRPSTCTVGVGYWATDEGEWNSAQGGSDGRFYKCTSTNTWTLFYTPYTYPHPLVSGSGDPPGHSHSHTGGRSTGGRQ